jgi:hypothetical protein
MQNPVVRMIAYVLFRCPKVDDTHLQGFGVIPFIFIDGENHIHRLMLFKQRKFSRHAKSDTGQSNLVLF